MKAAVITFPGSNCDRDMQVAFERASGRAPVNVWHKETVLSDGLDIVAVPGGFSFGDYLRCGAIAARAPIMNAVVDFALRGGLVLGVCNGFQILIEAGLLPGALMRNAGLKYVCRPQALRVATHDSVFTAGLGETATYAIAHHDGNYIADPEGLARLAGEDRIAFTYEGNPNGSLNDIAGVLSENRRVLGMMPHPERMNDPALGGTDGAAFFDGLVASLETA
ncbi:phosphoribosylformylglycinamidine synthase subunit PurQ [Roseobacter sp. HKCCA0434]|uniref:phosphoribosylformylglycinamidine synthase subunit PurQ n=1 Tax=Roseobacter sp. HKCCA0434 TaxID=3079297 RepID=UPI002905CB40|nr:phosphoribosylformylglycinamidine synthase subunit PurQ [Roseobacter sp. HKCCA0434]